ncbi:MAG TPA: hypothetical protein VMW27_13485 [Thermoanaerobaculia bacterium]|nr:hypothetical protein [Thermoanaerobaculia bacterium]
MAIPRTGTHVETGAELLAVLLAAPREDRRALAGSSRRFRSRELCELLIASSFELRYTDADQMEERASLALSVAGQLDAVAAGGARELQDLRAKACAHLGNAFRIRGRFAAAERALARARVHWFESFRDAVLEATILEFTATLLESRRDFHGALEQLEQACAIHRERGDNPALVQTLIKAGIVWGYANRPATAVRLLRQALGLIEVDRDPRLAWIALHALTWNLVDAGYPEEALAVHHANEDLAQHARSPLMELKAIWLQGHMAAALGQHETAERRLVQARYGYEEREMPYEAALVSLELAVLYARTGRFAELDGLTGEILPIFQTLGIEPEAAATVLLHRSVVQRERAVELLSQVITAVKLIGSEPAAAMA